MNPWHRYGAAGALRKAAHALADYVWPPTSPLTGDRVSARGLLEADSWTGIHFLAAPWCACCGLPFAFPVGDGAECAACLARAPIVSRARAAIAYGDASRRLVLDFKHGGRLDALDRMAGWMVRAGQDVLAETDALIPVPLHPARLFARRFNQSLLLARAIAARTGLPVESGWLIRRRRTPSQAGQTGRGRRRNVAGAFAVTGAGRNTLPGRSVTLIDDVLTTGATFDACARPLQRAGVSQVNALALARVVKPVDPTT